MEKKIGFIGCGNMGKPGSSRRSDCQRSGASRANLGIYPLPPDKVAALHDQFGINAAKWRKKWRKSPTSFLPPLNLAS